MNEYKFRIGQIVEHKLNRGRENCLISNGVILTSRIAL